MSRSNPNESLQNVATKFFDWNSDDSCFKYFDKTLGTPDKDGKVKGENVNVKLPFTFLVLDVLTTIKGYNEPEGKSYWSNEIRDTRTDILVVKSKSGVEATGTYAQVKAKLANSGAKYVQSVYIAYKEGKELVIANIQMKGASGSAFMDFAKDNKIYECAITVRKSIPKKKGRNNYTEPVFEATKITEATNEQAKELDKKLQEYLTACFARNASNPTPAEEVKSEPAKETKSEPKANGRSAKKEEPEEEEVADIDLDDSDDMPF